MAEKHFIHSYDEAEGYAELFGVIKEAVESVLGARRAGLMLGISNLGASVRGSVGAYYPTGSNLLVLNEAVLSELAKSQPAKVKPFTFYVILHEYLHSLGIFDEMSARRTAALVSEKALGAVHEATQIALDPSGHFPRVQYDLPGDRTGNIRLVKGFDRESESYFS
jgi:hypothetical protein